LNSIEQYGVTGVVMTLMGWSWRAALPSLFKKLLMHAAFSYLCMPPSATCVCRLQLLVYAALSYLCMPPSATCVCHLNLLVHAALSYLSIMMRS
jgi:hypothetical protein